jgi:hypothetical protein
MQTPPTWSTYPIKSENEIEIKIKIEDSTEWSMASMESENKKTNQFFKKQHKIKTYTIPLILYHGPTLNFWKIQQNYNKKVNLNKLTLRNRLNCQIITI